MKAVLYEKRELSNKRHVFKDRSEAGDILAEMMSSRYLEARGAMVLAIPAGGAPVGIRIGEHLRLPFDLMIVRKIQIPGNTEAGFGAMTPEGDVFLNEELLSYLNLAPAQIELQKEAVRRDLEERNRIFRAARAFPDLSGKKIILADDGVASGYTMMASIHMVKHKGAGKTIIAVPTAPLRSIRKIESLVDEIYCANIRDTSQFAVADAYRNWYDLTRQEVLDILKGKTGRAAE